MVYTDKYENSVAGQYNVKRHDQKKKKDRKQIKDPMCFIKSTHLIPVGTRESMKGFILRSRIERSAFQVYQSQKQLCR